MSQMTSMSQRKVLDCRKMPGSTCSLAISGTEHEVLKAGVEHAVSSHGHKNSPALKEQLKTMMTNA